MNWNSQQVDQLGEGNLHTYGRKKEFNGEFIVSITHAMGLNLARLIPFIIMTNIVRKQVTKNKDILYAEVQGQLEAGVGQTITVWRKGKDMVSFRDSGWHKIALMFFGWTLNGKNVHSYFITYKTSEIPLGEEAEEIAKTYGTYMHKGEKIRKSNRPPVSI
ncbi:hypothetical protein [Halalkalibacter akibai]|uniref:Uncharacterized protein n=1 Tax=Halalkalibacter akibai (strain ATCC 43226 / DSM 21942 / CIP 109018 / JCM 9157 / 1139) TaxID=1236973 RepID=W4QWA9_HALA3|nr:hypothetical protein [Halalkalibacter akibai]GAE36391.1 hypothetical protein JCM9157_3569 [Halalkalibacter akibai JCM 9157]